MRRFAWLSLAIFLLVSALAPPVSAASALYNDPHGQFSLVLPDTYKIVEQQYYNGPEDKPGFKVPASSKSPAIPSRQCAITSAALPNMSISASSHSRISTRSGRRGPMLR